MKKHTILFVLVVSILFSCKKDKEEETIPNDPFANIEIETQTPTNISNSAAQITSDLKDLDLADISTFGHVWSTSQNPTTDLSTKTEFTYLDEGSIFTSELVALKLNTTYYVRPYFTTSSKEVYYGEEISFTTANDFFKFVVGPDYFYSNTYGTHRKWVILYNENNELLEYFELINGSTYDLEWPENPTEYYNLYFFTLKEYDTASSPSPDNIYDINAKIHIKPKSYSIQEDERLEPIGQNKVNVFNYDYSVPIQIFSKKDGISVYDNDNYWLDQYFNPDDMWVLAGDWYGGLMSYKWIPGLELNETVEVDFLELEPMNDFQTMNFPSSQNNFAYIESANDLTTPDVWEYYPIYYNHTTEEATLKYYYPTETFQDYWYYFWTYDQHERNYMVQNRGMHPSEFVSMDIDYLLNNSSVYSLDLGLSVETDMDFVKIRWDVQNDSDQQFVYSITTPLSNSINYSAPELPEEFVAFNPDLINLDNLDFSYLYFRDFSLTHGYEDYQNRYNEIFSAAEEEYQVLWKYIYADKSKMPKENLDFQEEIKRAKFDMMYP